jgi:transcription antitermination factor NusG
VNTKWYAIYTRPRWEKKVNFLLQGKGIESYCPLNKVRRKWSDRIKTIEEPLFKSYVFVKIDESSILYIGTASRRWLKKKKYRSSNSF